MLLVELASCLTSSVCYIRMIQPMKKKIPFMQQMSWYTDA